MPGILAPDETSERETRAGTKYEVAKWTCPKCKQARSTLYIDDEWCHGDSYHIAFGGSKEPIEQCGTCWRTEIDAMPHNRIRKPSKIERSGYDTSDEGQAKYFGAA